MIQGVKSARENYVSSDSVAENITTSEILLDKIV
jgi:hypothetical protein